jgi:hypothetical protein
MGEIPAAGTEPTTPSNARSGGRFGRLDAALDVVGLLVLAWMLLLWQSGFPGFTDRVRAEMSLALCACAAILAIVVLVRLGRPSGPARPVAAAPLLMFLVGVAGWRFVVGFVRVVGQRQTSGAAVHVGLWDGDVVALARRRSRTITISGRRSWTSRTFTAVRACCVQAQRTMWSGSVKKVYNGPSVLPFHSTSPRNRRRAVRVITWRITVRRGGSSHTSRSARSASRCRMAPYCHSDTQAGAAVNRSTSARKLSRGTQFGPWNRLSSSV